MPSSTFSTTDSREIGRQFDGTDLLSFLYTATTLLILHIHNVTDLPHSRPFVVPQDDLKYLS